MRPRTPTAAGNGPARSGRPLSAVRDRHRVGLAMSVSTGLRGADAAQAMDRIVAARPGDVVPIGTGHEARVSETGKIEVRGPADRQHHPSR
jgi:hypothetical protein